MTNVIMVVVAFFLVLPILFWLPLGFSLKGKIILALQSAVTAIGVVMLAPYVLFWQNALIFSLILFIASYFTLKYGVAKWTIDGHEDEIEVKELVMLNEVKAEEIVAQKTEHLSVLGPVMEEEKEQEEHVYNEMKDLEPVEKEDEDQELDVIEPMWETPEQEDEQDLSLLELSNEDEQENQEEEKEDYYLESLFDEADKEETSFEETVVLEMPDLTSEERDSFKADDSQKEDDLYLEDLFNEIDKAKDELEKDDGSDISLLEVFDDGEVEEPEKGDVLESEIDFLELSDAEGFLEKEPSIQKLK
jgi:hypothetical protein